MTALVDFPGGDEVRLVVHTRDDQQVELALPTARACEELCGRGRATPRRVGRSARLEAVCRVEALAASEPRSDSAASQRRAVANAGVATCVESGYRL